MTTLISIILVLLMLAYIIYPFLRRKHMQLEPHETKIGVPRKNDLEDDIENRILKLRQKKGNSCPKCGTINQLDARYCRQCAASLSRGK